MKFQGNILFHLSKSAVQMRCNALLGFCYQFLIYSSLSCTLHGRYMLTAAYLLAIQCYTRAGGKVSVILIKYEKNQGEESSAASLVYKVILIFSWMLRIFFSFPLVSSLSLRLQVFGLYFVQSYIGLFYHALLHRNLLTLRKILIQRLIVSQACYLFCYCKTYL